MLLCPKAGIMVCSLFHLICRVLPQLLSLTWSFSTSVKEAFIAVNYHQPAKPFFLNDQNSHSAYTYQDFIRCHLDSGINKGLVSLFKFGCRCLPLNDHGELQKRHSKTAFKSNQASQQDSGTRRKWISKFISVSQTSFSTLISIFVFEWVLQRQQKQQQFSNARSP